MHAVTHSAAVEVHDPAEQQYGAPGPQLLDRDAIGASRIDPDDDAQRLSGSAPADHDQRKHQEACQHRDVLQCIDQDDRLGRYVFDAVLQVRWFAAHSSLSLVGRRGGRQETCVPCRRALYSPHGSAWR